MSDVWGGLTPDTSSLDAWTTWWNKHSASITQAQRDKYQPYLTKLNDLIGWNASTGSWDNTKWPTYKPVEWGDTTDPTSYASRYANQQQGMDALLARIGAGPQASDNQEALDAIAQLYGYFPASFTAIQQGMTDRLNASNVMTNAASVALGMENTAFGQEQQKAMRVAQQQATEQVGKQLEAIFGERGGLAGFQAAYDMTSQLQSTFLQEQSRNSLAMFDRAVSAVNAENGYYQDLINRGVIQAQDYLKFRWDALQNGYQDYILAMDQTMKEWTTKEQVAEEQYSTQAKVIQDQINAIGAVLAQEMGVDQATLDYLDKLYKHGSDVATDTDAVTGNPATDPQAAGAAVGSAGDFAVGVGLAFLAIPSPDPVTKAIGLSAIVIGGVLKLGGWLLGLL